MTFRGTAAIVGLDDVLGSELDRVERVITEAVTWGGEGMIEDLRDQTFAGGLGGRLPYTWKLRRYPGSGSSLEPSAYVYSKAPRIIGFFSAERVITPTGGAFAIAVNPVIKRGGKPMTIFEVETRFNQDLEPRRLPSGHIGLFADLVRGKSARRPGFRRQTAGRVRQGRRAEKVLMFVLVRSLRSKKLIDLIATAERWAARTVERIKTNLERGA